MDAAVEQDEKTQKPKMAQVGCAVLVLPQVWNTEVTRAISDLSVVVGGVPLKEGLSGEEPILCQQFWQLSLEGGNIMNCR